MTRAAVIIATLALLLGTGAGAYHMGRGNGFDQGWDKGYIRGLENPQNGDAFNDGYEQGISDESVKTDEANQAYQAAYKKGRRCEAGRK